MGFEQIMGLLGLLGNAESATDRDASVPDRAAAVAGGAGTALTTAGAAASGISSAGLGAASMGSVGSIVGGGGAVGVGAGALAAGGVLSAGAAGYGVGTAIDKLGGRAMGALGSTRTVTGRGLGGGTHEETDDRRLSARLGDMGHTPERDATMRNVATYLPTWLGGDGW